MKHKILLINGPNLNRMDRRFPPTGVTLEALEQEVIAYAAGFDIEVDTFFSNHEGRIIEKVQEAEGLYDGIVMNPGPLAQYSHAIRAVLTSLTIPSAEVHFVNIHKTGEVTITGRGNTGVICGFGRKSYLTGIDAIRHMIEEADESGLTDAGR